jgi:type IV conjugative transfer system protein TraE
MQQEKYRNKLSALAHKYGGLMVYAIIMSVGCIVATGMSVYAVMYQKTVVLPPGQLSAKIVVSGDSVNEEYLLEFSRAMFDMALDFSPKNAKAQLETVLLYVDPASYGKYRKKFDEEIQNIEVSGAVSAFVVDDTQFDGRRKIVKVIGKRLLLVADQVVSAENETHALEYRVKAGRLYWKEMGKWDDMQKGH